jgi:uracil phosphoribosyltransferase
MAMKKEQGFLDGLTERLAKKSSAVSKVRAMLNESIENRKLVDAARKKHDFIQGYVNGKVANQKLLGGLGGAHYGESMDPHHMMTWAARVAEHFEEKHRVIPILVYRGMSGIATATHLSVALENRDINHGMIYVRKDEERSHGSDIERRNLPAADDKYIFVFCDDFVCGGDTLRQTMRKCQKSLRFRINVDKVFVALSEGAERIKPVIDVMASFQKEMDEGWEEVLELHRKAALSEWEHKQWVEERIAARKANPDNGDYGWIDNIMLSSQS